MRKHFIRAPESSLHLFHLVVRRAAQIPWQLDLGGKEHLTLQHQPLLGVGRLAQVSRGQKHGRAPLCSLLMLSQHKSNRICM